VVCALAALAFAFVLEPAAAAGAVAGPPASRSPSTQATEDCQLTVFARQALQDDETLAPLNIGVSVHGGVATLWGTVADAAIGRRAHEQVRQVQGVTEVRNELRVETLPQPVQAAAPPTPRQSARIDPGWAERFGALGALLSRPGPHPVAPADRVAAGTDQAPSGPPLLVMPAIRVPTAASRLAPGELVLQIEALRRRDGRFRGVHAVVTGGVVTLGGNVAAWEDLFELARTVSRIPGVERVILGDVHTPGDPPQATPGR
jgi:hypothetical protein